MSTAGRARRPGTQPGHQERERRPPGPGQPDDEPGDRQEVRSRRRRRRVGGDGVCRGPASAPAARGRRRCRRRRRPRRGCRRGDGRAVRGRAGRRRRRPGPVAGRAAAGPRRASAAARRTAAPVGPVRRCGPRRSPPAGSEPPGWVEAWTISQPAVAVRATPDADARAPTSVLARQRPRWPAGAAGASCRLWVARVTAGRLVRHGRCRGGASSTGRRPARPVAGRWATTTTAASPAELDDGVRDHLLGQLVQVRGRLVEQHPRTVREDDAGQGESCSLAG